MKIQSRIARRTSGHLRVLMLCYLMIYPTLSLLGGEKKSNEDKAQSSSRAAAYYHFSQARLLDENGDFLKALEEYKKAVQQDPKSSNLYIELANAYLRHRRVQRCDPGG